MPLYPPRRTHFYVLLLRRGRHCWALPAPSVRDSCILAQCDSSSDVAEYSHRVTYNKCSCFAEILLPALSMCLTAGRTPFVGQQWSLADYACCTPVMPLTWTLTTPVLHHCCRSRPARRECDVCDAATSRPAFVRQGGSWPTRWPCCFGQCAMLWSTCLCCRQRVRDWTTGSDFFGAEVSGNVTPNMLRLSTTKYYMGVTFH